MADITPVFKLRCKHCGYEMPDDAVMESYLLHMQVEHNTDKVDLDLCVVCTCGAAMKLISTRQTSNPEVFVDRFKCSFDDNRTSVRRKNNASDTN